MSLDLGFRSGSGGGGGGGTGFTSAVANYSALPAASGVSGEYYWASAIDVVGGVKYPAGAYRSNGTTWEFDTAYTQAAIWGSVTNYAALPLGTTAADPQINDLVAVNNTTGIWLINQRLKGYYRRVAMTGVSATDYGTEPFAGFSQAATQSQVNTGTDTDSFVNSVTFNGASKWANYLLTTLTSGNIFVGNASNVATSVAMSGDATISNTGVLTVAANAIGLTKLFQTATRRILGRISATTGNHESLTIDQVWTLLTNATNNTSSGTLNDVSTSDLNYLRFTNAPTINGFANGASGKVLFIFNDNSTNSITLNHQNVGSIAANRIIIGQGQSAIIPAQTMAIVVYDSTDSRWFIQGIFGNTYFPTLAGTGVRGVQTDANGNIAPVAYQSMVSGQAVLVAGVVAVTITGLTTSSLALGIVIAVTGGTQGTTYKAVCTANTLTITAITTTGTTVITDTSTLNYLIQV